MVKRKNARILSFVLTLTIVMSMFCMGTVAASAAETDITESSSGSGATAVLNNAAKWSTCYVYYWGNDGGVTNASWPGVKLTDSDKNADGYYEVAIAEKYLSGVNGVIFNNGSTQSDNLDIASGESKIYNNSDRSWKEYDTNPLKLSVSMDAVSPQYSGTSIAITATSSGATGTCTYTFKANTTTIYTGSKNTCTWTPSTAGTYTISVSVKDTAGNSNEKTQSFEIKDSSNVAEPVLKGVTIGTSGYGVVNKSTSVKVNAAGGKVGTNLLFYKVAVKDPSGNAVNTVYYTQSNTLNFTPTKTGNYTAEVSVQNSYNAVEKRTFTVPVKSGSVLPTEAPTQVVTTPSSSDPVISSFTADKTTVEAGSPIKFTTTVKSGTGKPKYTYTFKADSTVLNESVSSKTTATYTWTPTTEGTYTVKGIVVDANNVKVYKTVKITVTPKTSTELAIASLKASATTVEVGNPVDLTTTVKSGTGTPSFTYTFKANDTTVKAISSSERTATYSWTPTVAGTYTIKALVKDSTAKVVSTTITITVKASTTVAPEISSFTADKTTVEAGSPVKFTTTVKSGTGKPKYTYTFKADSTVLNESVSSNTTATYTWTPTTEGTYTVKGIVVDANNVKVYKTVKITVTKSTFGGTFTMTPSTGVKAGDVVHLKAVMKGGQPNYTYSVKVNGVITHVQSISSKEFSYDWVAPKAGDYQISIIAKDANGETSYKKFSSITVAKASTSYIKGDVDGNGKVTSADAQYVLYYLTGTAGYTIKSGTNAFKAADMDGDGVITYSDAILITRML